MRGAASSPRLPLARVLPAIFLATLAVTLAGGWVAGERRLARDYRAELLAEGARRGVALQGTIEELVRVGSTDAVREAVAALGSDPTLQLAALLDERGQVLASTRLEALGRPAATLFAVGEREQRARAWLEAQAGRPSRLVDAKGDDALALLPVALDRAPGQLRPARGALLLWFDTRRPAARRYDERLAFAPIVWAGSLMTLALWALLHLVVARRVGRLAGAARQLAAGDFAATPALGGHDELADLGAAFERMARELAAGQRRVIESEESLRRALREAAEALFILSPDGLYLEVSDRACELLGYSREELVGHELTEFAALDEFAPRPPSLAALAPGEKVVGERRVRRKDGSWLESEISIRRLQDGRLQAVLLDIGARKASALALRRSREELERIVAEIPAGLALVRDGTIVFVNAALCRALGVTAQEAVGAPLSGSIPGGLERASPFGRWEAQVRRPDGELVLLELSIGGEVEHDGAPATLVVAQDVTGRARMERQLALTDRLASVGTLAAGMAHEINNPLGYVLTNAELALRQLAGVGTAARPNRDAQLRELLEEILHGAERIRLIVKDLKGYSRVDGIAAAPSDLKAIAGRALQLAGAELRHRARLEQRLAPTPVVLADPSRLEQVLVNLLINAGQALPEDSVAANEIVVTTGATASGAAFAEVRDNGPGIEPAVLSRIFDPFFTTKPQGVGTGLGLFVCHQIVVAAGGELTATSEPGEGACFRVVLPAHAAEVAVAAGRSLPAAQAPALQDEPRLRILLIDDEPMLRRSLSRSLEPHEVVAVADCEEALVAARTGPFDVVLCDLMLAGNNGVELLERLRVEEPALATRFVFMTGGAFSEALQERLVATGLPVLAKPFDRDTALAALRLAAGIGAAPEAAPQPEVAQSGDGGVASQ